mmetsp:Transcript_3672/g.23017  ORF Transcript_3672/g.23017 Transcript_3672/m.23017 type:complete len:86 (-) Transcript_3672:3937-4194(-)
MPRPSTHRCAACVLAQIMRGRQGGREQDHAGWCKTEWHEGFKRRHSSTYMSGKKAVLQHAKGPETFPIPMAKPSALLFPAMTLEK